MRTKKLKHISFFLCMLSILLSFGPLIVYSCISFASQADVVGKVTLVSMITVGIVLSLVCVINKYTPRCRLWLILIGLYMCLDNFIGCVLVMAITQCLDELIVAPLHKKYKHLYTINKEIDKRG